MKNSIRTRLAITFVALAASLLFVVGAVLAWQSYLTDQRRAVELQRELASRISTQVASYMQIQENTLKELIQVRGLSELDRDQQTNLLSELLSYTDAFDNLTLLGRNGREQIVVSRTNLVAQLSDRSTAPEFTVPKAKKQIYYSPVQFAEKTGEPFLFISVPITDIRTGAVTNVLVANVRFKPVWDLLDSMPLGEGSNAYIVDSNNRIIAHNNPSIVLRDTLFTIPDQDGTHIGASGNNVVLATDKITLGDEIFTIVAETSTSEAFAGIIRTELTIALLFLISIALASGLGWLAARQIVEPIEDLAATAERVTAGDLSQKAKVVRKDEIGALGIAFNTMTAQLRGLIGNLEQRVAERTAELEESSNRIEKRASQLETIADVANSVASLRDVNELLPYITQTISERFGFYHTGIFLLSEDKEYAVLRAANSEGGQKMLARRHQLRIGQEGVVGHSIAQKRAHIALDVGKDAVFFNNPDLPATHSEMALPLLIGSDVIGALDVQSEQPNAFSNEDIKVLTILANQVAVAIENARLFQQSQNTLRELDQTFQRYVSNEWRQFTADSRVTGYRANEAGLEPITNASKDKKPSNGNKPIQKIPIMLRGATLGTLNIDMGERTRTYTDEDFNLIKTVADRLALALESARLLEDSQRVAAKEQVIGEITGKIGSSINLRNVLQTAVEELGHAIPGSEVVIQLNPKTDSEAK
jgi:GAF domain-containing protein/HAMP domain-containing protein